MRLGRHALARRQGAEPARREGEGPVAREVTDDGHLDGGRADEVVEPRLRDVAREPAELFGRRGREPDVGLGERQRADEAHAERHRVAGRFGVRLASRGLERGERGGLHAGGSVSSGTRA
jgi:hypothetical protein